MNRMRFTLAQLMAVVFYCGLGFAALRNADRFWASAMFSVAIVSVAVAAAAALAGKGRARTAWAAFALAGGARLVIWLSTFTTVGFLDGPPRALLHGYQAYLSPMAAGGAPYIAYTQICNSLDVIILGLSAAIVASLVAGRQERGV